MPTIAVQTGSSTNQDVVYNIIHRHQKTIVDYRLGKYLDAIHFEVVSVLFFFHTAFNTNQNICI